jgi:hypothetical protein
MKMKNITKYLTILLLLSVALTSIVYMGISNVGADPVSATPTPTPTTTPTFASFFNCIFGVHIFPGADPMGSYTVNLPTSGSVSGHIYYYEGYGQQSRLSTIVYLSSFSTTPIFSDKLVQNIRPSFMPFGSYITTTDNRGYFMINNIPFGNYTVCACSSMNLALAGQGAPIKNIYLTPTSANALINTPV